MNQRQLKDIIEAALFAAGRPLNNAQLLRLFSDEERPDEERLQAVLDSLATEWEDRGIELRQVGSGYRFQVKATLAPWISRLSEERAPRYSRALLETLALIVYRQPITRAGIEEVRGVAVSSSMIRTLLEREWIRVVGHRDVPGKPALYGTTRKFLDYFNLSSLSELPPLSEIRPVDHMQEELELPSQGSETEEGLEGATTPNVPAVPTAPEPRPENPAGNPANCETGEVAEAVH